MKMTRKGYLYGNELSRCKTGFSIGIKLTQVNYKKCLFDIDNDQYGQNNNMPAKKHNGLFKCEVGFKLKPSTGYNFYRISTTSAFSNDKLCHEKYVATCYAEC